MKMIINNNTIFLATLAGIVLQSTLVDARLLFFVKFLDFKPTI